MNLENFIDASTTSIAVVQLMLRSSVNACEKNSKQGIAIMESLADESVTLDTDIAECLSWPGLPESPLDENHHFQDKIFNNDDKFTDIAEYFIAFGNKSSSSHALKENKLKIHNNTGCVLPPLNWDKFDELFAFRTMPSQSSDFITGTYTKNMSQETDFFSSLNNFNTINTGNEANAIPSELYDFLFETSTNNENSHDISAGMELFESDRKTLHRDINNNNVCINDMSKVFPGEGQSFLADLAVLHDADQSFFCLSDTSPSYEDETGSSTSCEENFLKNDTTFSDQSEFKRLTVNQINGQARLENAREKPGTETETRGSKQSYPRLECKQRRQSSDKKLCLTKDIRIKVEPNRLAASKGYYQLGTDPYLRAYREHINHKQRLRVEKLNNGYKSLHAALPTDLAKQKLSKLEILLQAIRYIKWLDNTLQNYATENEQDHSGIDFSE